MSCRDKAETNKPKKKKKKKKDYVRRFLSHTGIYNMYDILGIYSFS